MMLIYLPVKFEFDWTYVFELESGNKNVDGRTDKRTKNRQTKKRNYTNFERILAMMVIYLPVKFEFDWTHHFPVRVRKQNCGQTDKWTKNGQTNGRNYTNFERNLAMMVIYLPVKLNSIGQTVFELESGNENVDRQTDVRHINLIGGLVTCNPPKNVENKRKRCFGPLA